MIYSFFNPVMYNGKSTTNIFKSYSAYMKRALINFKPRTYFINGAPRPEQLAYQLYGNEQYYWVLLLLNNIYDPYHDWIKTQEACYESAIQKYKDMPNTADQSIDNEYNNRVLYHMNENGERFYRLVEDKENPRNWYDVGDVDKKHIQYVGALRPVDIFEDAILENELKRQILIIAPSEIDAFVDAFSREMEKVSE